MSTKSHDAADIMVVAINRERPTWEGCLRSWVGPGDESDRALKELAGLSDRYVLIASVDIGGNPRYVHRLQLFSSLDGLTVHLLRLMDTAEHIGRATHARQMAFDINYLLLPDERDRINHILDERTAERLRHVPARGNA